MPAVMEERDDFMTNTMEELEAMVKVAGKPAVVIGHSYGCLVSKWFLHFCLVEKGEEWLEQHVQHYVPLGDSLTLAVSICSSYNASSRSLIDYTPHAALPAPALHGIQNKITHA